MDEWNVNDVVEWFQTIGHIQYEKRIREHQVGGRPRTGICCCI